MSAAYLGIDLAAQPAGTAACRLVFRDGAGAVVEELRAGLDDDALDTLRAGARVVGIDSPFGWPRAFTAAVGAWAQRAEWPAETDARSLRLRATDLEVQPAALAALAREEGWIHLPAGELAALEN